MENFYAKFEEWIPIAHACFPIDHAMLQELD